MRLRRSFVVACAVLLSLSGAACEEQGQSRRDVADCGLPTPQGDIDIARVPPEFLLDGEAEVRKVHQEGGLLIIALNLYVPVAEAYEAYTEALSLPRYETITEDYEGFEFELYLREVDEDRLVAVQGRRPLCDEATAVYVTVDRSRRHRDG